MCEDLENRLFIHGDTVSVNAPTNIQRRLTLTHLDFEDLKYLKKNQMTCLESKIDEISRISIIKENYRSEDDN